MNAVVILEALRLTCSDPSRASFIRAREGLTQLAAGVGKPVSYGPRTISALTESSACTSPRQGLSMSSSPSLAASSQVDRILCRCRTFVLLLIVCLPLVAGCSNEPPPIKVGILHSLSGTMAISERSVYEATLMAIEELNADGGVLDRPVEAVVADGGSDSGMFAAEAERLLAEESVAAVFGVWTSAHRKSVLPIFEAQDGLLFYPVQHEGLEESPNIVYLGATPNQQIIPAVQWAQKYLGRRAYLIGSDYVFPRVAHEIIRDELDRFGAQVVGERFIPLGSRAMEPIIRDIQQSTPDLIFNTLNGSSNIAFFQALRDAGISSERIPTVSFSLGEAEIGSMNANLVAGDYAAWNYFQSLSGSANSRFVTAFRQRFGQERMVGDPMESAYNAVHLWAGAVDAAGSTDVSEVRRALANRTLSAPQGRVRMDAANLHLWQFARIGRVRNDGQFDLIWESSLPIAPEVFPKTGEPSDWHSLLQDLQDGWDGAWSGDGSD